MTPRPKQHRVRPDGTPLTKPGHGDRKQARRRASRAAKHARKVGRRR